MNRGKWRKRQTEVRLVEGQPWPTQLDIREGSVLIIQKRITSERVILDAETMEYLNRLWGEVNNSLTKGKDLLSE